MGQKNSARLLEQACEQLEAGDRKLALSTSIMALCSADEDPIAASALHQIAILIDDHPLPTHDELAWRAQLEASRRQPAIGLYAAEAVRRHIFRLPFVQLFRSVGNLFLYAALVLVEPARRFPFLWLVLGPASLPLVLPGILAHLLARSLGYLMILALARRVRDRIHERPLDETLISDLQQLVL